MSVLSYKSDLERLEQLRKRNVERPSIQEISLEVIDCLFKTNMDKIEDSRANLEEWSNEDASLIEWFQTATLPIEPFKLGMGVKVLDCEKFYSSLKIDIVAGPKRPRASFGGLQSDLRALREFVLMNY